MGTEYNFGRQGGNSDGVRQQKIQPQISAVDTVTSPEGEHEFVQFSDMKQVAQFLGIKGKVAVAQIFDTGIDGSNLRDRDLDSYLSQLGLFSGADYAVVRDLLPGHGEFVKKLGFTSQVLEINTNPASSVHPDPLQNEKLKQFLLAQKSTVITPFYNQHHSQNTLNYHNPERNVGEISKLANSKPHLHTVGKEMRVPLFEGGVTYNLTQTLALAQKIGFPLWAKIDGSGSDFVVKCNNPADVQKAVQEFMNALAEGRQKWVEEYAQREIEVDPEMLKSLNVPNYSQNPNTPFAVPVVLEQDASRVGTFKHNLCISGVLSHNDFAMACISSQVVGSNGEWWGSQKADLEPEVVALIQEKIQPLLNYWQSLGYVGPVGPDCIVYENEKGQLDLGWIDPNARNPISMVPELIGNKLGLPVWRNTNITFPSLITDFNQLQPLIKSIESQIPNCKVVPLAFRSTEANPSRVCKLAIFTDNQESLNKAFEMLSQQVIIGS